MKKMFLTLAFAIILPTTSFASHEFTTPLAPGVLDQFDGIVINGQTAQEAVTAIQPQIKKTTNASIYAGQAYLEQYADKYNELTKRERAMADISSRMQAYAYTSPYEYISTAGGYMHWLAFLGIEEGCFHTSVQALEAHAALFEQRVDAYFKYEDVKNERAKIAETLPQDVEHKYINDVLAPFVEAKELAYAEKLKATNESIKDYNCRVEVGTKVDTVGAIASIFGIASSGTKIKYCKDDKNCHFIPIWNKDILTTGCTCGHSISDHHIKYKKTK